MKSIRWVIALSLLLFAMLALPALASQDGSIIPGVDPKVVDLIIAGVAGIGVIGVTEMLKRALKASGFFSYVISAVVSAGVTALYFAFAGKFTIVTWLAYSAAVFIEANGLYKAIVKAPKGA